MVRVCLICMGHGPDLSLMDLDSNELLSDMVLLMSALESLQLFVSRLLFDLNNKLK